MNKKIFFDDSLPLFAKFVVEELGTSVLERNFFLRDALGVLSFIVLDDKISSDLRSKLSAKVEVLLDGYVDHDGFAFTTPDELFDDNLKDINITYNKYIVSDIFTGHVRLLERRIMGSDWLRQPQEQSKKPNRIVFSSIKGGVGRSTALCVIAASLAQQGLRVLTIDMDLEAPGLGNMLLKGDVLPDYGLLDYFVEKNIYELNDDFFIDVVGSSWISAGKGRVDVVPALGRLSLENPSNVLSKISRAYLSKPDAKGETQTFMDFMSFFIDKITPPNRYDVILIDARSGLHETTASAMIGLDADILCFGIDQPQTFSGYELLFSSLSNSSALEANWLSRLHFVQAKASDKLSIRKTFAQKMEDKINFHFNKVKPLEFSEAELFKDTFEVEWQIDANDIVEQEQLKILDENWANTVIAIPDDNKFQNFDPILNGDLLSEELYRVTFGELVTRIKKIIDTPMEYED